MKNRVIGAFFTFLIGSGITVYNYSGKDITTQNGEVIKTFNIEKELEKQWRNRPFDSITPITLFIHHTVTSKNANTEQLNNIHLGNGWAGLSYHITIEYDGDINLINLFDKLTWHTKGNNMKGLSIALVGNYEENKVSNEMEDSVRKTIDFLCNHSGLNIVAIKPHKAVKATLCPGEYATETFKDLFFE